MPNLERCIQEGIEASDLVRILDEGTRRFTMMAFKSGVEENDEDFLYHLYWIIDKLKQK